MAGARDRTSFRLIPCRVPWALNDLPGPCLVAISVRMTLLNISIGLAMAATVAVLLLGLLSMARGGEYDREHAETFMWERVALQGLVIGLLLVAAVMLNI